MIRQAQRPDPDLDSKPRASGDDPEVNWADENLTP